MRFCKGFRSRNAKVLGCKEIGADVCGLQGWLSPKFCVSHPLRQIDRGEVLVKRFRDPLMMKLPEAIEIAALDAVAITVAKLPELWALMQ